MLVDSPAKEQKAFINSKERTRGCKIKFTLFLFFQKNDMLINNSIYDEVNY